MGGRIAGGIGGGGGGGGMNEEMLPEGIRSVTRGLIGCWLSIATAPAVNTIGSTIMIKEALSSDRVDEGSPLIHANDFRNRSGRLDLCGRWGYFAVWAVVASFVLSAVHHTVKKHRQTKQQHSHHHVFPHDFVWGSATSAYQIEGAAHEDGRGLSIWDTFCQEPNAIMDGSSGNVACNHYHLMDSDVQLMKELGLQAYRFSIAWPRVLPNGTGQVNAAGIAFYNRLIDTLIANDIEPWVTLYHWDLPQALEDSYGGWLGRETVDAFGDYARLCFQAFGDRVQHWITMNESWTVAINGYNNGVHAPGRSDNPSTEPYIVAHNLILAHAKAAGIYHRDFAETQKGKIGVSHCADFRYPLTETQADEDAAERAMVFQLAWFADPIFKGDYPMEMRERLGRRLPYFTDEEKKQLMGSTDFLGLNHYSSLLASEPAEIPTYGGYWADIFVDFSARDEWRRNDMGWAIVPDGCREMLKWIAHRYHNPVLYMTENGSAEPEPFLELALHDEERRNYLRDYIRACAQAMNVGVNLRGYFAWSLMDNFEWQFGYQRRFGLVRVDFDTQVRTPKLSAEWYRETILANGSNMGMVDDPIV